MPKIKQVRVRNMIKAVALEDFVNLATGITVKKLTESGLYDKPQTIPTDPEDTSWVFNGATVKNTKLFCGSAVQGATYLESCVLYFANVDEVDAKGVNFQNGKYKNSILKNCVLKDCDIDGSNIVADSDNVMISNLNAQNVNIQVSLSTIEYCSLDNCRVIGKRINLTNSNVAHVEIHTGTDISDSTVMINELGRDEFFSGFSEFNTSNKTLCIRGAYSTNAKDILMLNIHNKNLCVFSRGGCNDVYIDEEGIVNTISQGIETFSQEGKGFLCDWSKELLNVEKFVNSEFDKIYRIAPVPITEEQTLKNILFRDIFEVLFSDNKEIMRTKFTNAFSIDIFSKEINDPENFVFISERLFEFIRRVCSASAAAKVSEKLSASNTVFWI